ncbi:MAG TPA: carboxypeptidase regulatory-like domain-containing protein [Candidatus Acidoferrales bacterium]|nr:carboxypeptidase regulatory-like domain-containing protein [Candidatus Acidoferrales bacterium]
MASRLKRISQFLALFVLCFLLCAPGALAQTATGSLRGQVTDPSGSAIVGAQVTVTSATGQVTKAVVGRDGSFEIKGLPPGKYAVDITAKGFAPFEVLDYDIPAGPAQKLDVSLTIAVQEEKVIVESATPTVDVSPEANAGSIVMTEKDLEALSDDPDELQNDLEALAGPSAGPNGGQIYIDGFTAGQLPPKSAIREIRINQNPFSSEYDKLGYGRIEIFTKPGMDRLHGNIEFQGNDSSFNSMNPFATTPEPGYESTLLSGNIGGPISKKASFFISGQYRDINDVSVVNASGSGSTFCYLDEPCNGSIPFPKTRVNIAPRLDFQVTPNNTLSVRYQYFRDDLTNNGLSNGFALSSQAYDSLNQEHTLQISDTQVFGTKIVNETRFQFLHDPFTQTPQSMLSTVIVPGAFTGGGSSAGTISQTTNHYEFQNYTQIVLKTQTVKFGARLRQVTVNDNANSGFNGTFQFASTAAFDAGTPAQFSIATGKKLTTDSMFDAGFYVQDDWKVRPNITLSGGLRLETQTGISDHLDWAPRVAAAWGIGHGKGAPKTVLRAGTGLFYDRFPENLILNARRFNGVNQVQCVVASPDFFPTLPPAFTPGSGSCAGLSSTSEPMTKYLIAPNLHAPGILQTALVLERQLTKSMNLSLTYQNARGFDQLLTNNINTPVCGLYPSPCPAPYVPNSGPIYPHGAAAGNLYEYQSEGVFRQNQFIVQFNVRAGAKLSLFTYYVLNYANSDTSGATSFSSNPYNISQDYGRASFDYRNRFFMGGTYALPHGFRISPFMFATSGQPYSITLSQDLIGSTQFNQRPAYATAPLSPLNVVSTSYGSFDTIPQPGETILPINSLTGPARFTMNVRLSKTWGFGERPESAGGPAVGGGGGGDRGGRRGPGGFGGFGGGPPTNKRYNLTLTVNARNIFNYTNAVTPLGVLNPPQVCGNPVVPPCIPYATPSPFFAKPNTLAQGPFSSQGASRIIYLQIGFSF